MTYRYSALLCACVCACVSASESIGSSTDHGSLSLSLSLSLFLSVNNNNSSLSTDHTELLQIVTAQTRLAIGNNNKNNNDNNNKDKNNNDNNDGAARQKQQTADRAATHARASPPASAASPDVERLLYIGVLSAPRNKENRQRCRAAFVSEIRSGKWKGVTAEFIIGHLPYQTTGHNQGSLPTREQLKLEEDLVAERQQHGDIIRIAMPDSYQNLPDKVLSLVRRSFEQGWQWIMKIDDDQMPMMDTVLRLAKCTACSKYIYAGSYLWDKEIYASQKGPDGSFAKYFSGPGYMLSYALAKAVAATLETQSAEFLTYGSSSEDVDMGRWVAFAQAQLATNVEYKILRVSQALEPALGHMRLVISTTTSTTTTTSQQQQQPQQ
ncbi:unnamed protein product [Polarella glacialis]|uniref:Hexosyltransferase n=1 Tax=Polarella glacialis TaxID=89957 RepID=A0A813IDL5_POLGL|nr:unnamed protein product [Polarella glacialis]